MKKIYVKPCFEAVKMNDMLPFMASKIDGQTDHGDSRRYNGESFSDDYGWGDNETSSGWNSGCSSQTHEGLWD